jgi:hypothetical protein
MVTLSNENKMIEVNVTLTWCIFLFAVPDLPLCLCVLKHKAPLAGGHLPAKRKITMDFCLCDAILIS